MDRMTIVSLSIAILLIVLDLGACLKCYKCQSAENPKCKDPFAREELQNYLLDCFEDQNPVLCQKIVSSNGTTFRRCLIFKENEIDQCQAHRNTTTSCEYCHGDGCNGVASIAASLPLTVLAGVIVYIFCKQ